MLAEPAEHGGQANDFLGLVPFGQIKNRRVAKLRKIRAQVDRRASTNKEQRRVVARMAPRIFDCEARFAYASQPMDRLTRALRSRRLRSASAASRPLKSGPKEL